MPMSQLNAEERGLLLKLARNAITERVMGRNPIIPEMVSLSPNLSEPGATFVTLTIDGQLRGCIGSLESTQSLVDDVMAHADAAAFHDYRFSPVVADELDKIHIEISRITSLIPLIFDNAEDLLMKLRPGIDGVILQDGQRRATFLPQVWEKIPDPSEFLDHLCIKMGASPELWRQKKVEIFIYEVEEFHE